MPRRPGPGDTVPGRWIRGPSDHLAIEEGCYFDENAGRRVAEFFRRFLRHAKGRQFKGKPFELLDWQDDALTRIYGWKRPDGKRRYREGYIEIPKKNGKSTMAAGIELFGLVADGEPGAQVYTAAADREQAGIIYKEAAAMVRSSPSLRALLKPVDSRKSILYPADEGILRALSAEVSTKEGLDGSTTVIDELHAHRSPALFQCLRYAGAARDQPLLLSITTAGYDRNSICFNQHDYAEKVIAGTVPDTSFFGLIYAADLKDDPDDPATWHKANPSLGHTITLDSFRADWRTAKNNPAGWNSWLRYRLNIWTQADVKWLAPGQWERCDRGPVIPADLHGVPCWGGLDLASTIDVCALVLLFATGDVLCRFYIPEEIATVRETRDRVWYETWAREGFMTATPGAAVDYQYIRDDLRELAKVFPIQRINADPYNATQLTQQLVSDGLTVKFMRQGFLSMNDPCKSLHRRIIAGDLNHGGNPVLAWMADNVVAETDASDNLKFSKDKSREKIDGLVALAMAEAARIDADRDAAGSRSVYETMKPRSL